MHFHIGYGQNAMKRLEKARGYSVLSHEVLE